MIQLGMAEVLAPGGLRIRIYGLPAPKGSPKIQTRDRAGRTLHHPRVLPDSPALERWARCVAGSALAAVHRRPQPFFRRRPLAVEITFVMPRPATRRKALFAHYAVGDLDKLVRATLDPLHGTVFDNDSRVVELIARKRYEEPGASIPLGAICDIWPLDAA